jgi:hypothetical protein
MKKIIYVPLLLVAALVLIFNGCKKDGLHSITKSDSTKTLSTDSINVLIKKATLSTVTTIDQAQYLTVDKNGTLYVIKYDNKIYKIAGGVTTVFYTPTSPDTSHNYVYGLSVDSAGNVYTMNRNSFAGTPTSLLKISTSGAASAFVSNFGQYLDAKYYDYISCLSVSANGDVFFEDIFDVVYKVTAGGTKTTVAQTAGGQFAVDKNENVYFVGAIAGQVVTQWNISKVTASGTTSVLAGPGKITLGNIVQGLSVDQWGNVFVSDAVNNVIYGIDTHDNVYTITSNYGGDVDGPLSTAKILSPSYQAIDGSGNLYFFETSYSQADIRKITR